MPSSSHIKTRQDYSRGYEQNADTKKMHVALRRIRCPSPAALSSSSAGRSRSLPRSVSKRQRQSPGRHYLHSHRPHFLGPHSSSLSVLRIGHKRDERRRWKLEGQATRGTLQKKTPLFTSCTRPNGLTRSAYFVQCRRNVLLAKTSINKRAARELVKTITNWPQEVVPSF